MLNSALLERKQVIWQFITLKVAQIDRFTRLGSQLSANWLSRKKKDVTIKAAFPWARIDSDKTGQADLQTGLFPGLANSRLGDRLTWLDRPARQAPHLEILPLSQQKSLVLKNSRVDSDDRHKRLWFQSKKEKAAE
jgi:hypothetical protein